MTRSVCVWLLQRRQAASEHVRARNFPPASASCHASPPPPACLGVYVSCCTPCAAGEIAEKSGGLYCFDCCIGSSCLYPCVWGATRCAPLSAPFVEILPCFIRFWWARRRRVKQRVGIPVKCDCWRSLPSACVCVAAWSLFPRVYICALIRAHDRHHTVGLVASCALCCVPHPCRKACACATSSSSQRARSAPSCNRRMSWTAMCPLRSPTSCLTPRSAVPCRRTSLRPLLPALASSSSIPLASCP